MDKPTFPSDRPLLTDADDRRKPQAMWSGDPAAHYAAEVEAIRAQVDSYEDLGDMPALPSDFTPHSSARMPLDSLARSCPPCNGECRQGRDCPAEAKLTWQRFVLPAMLLVALVGAIASCAFGGGR